jgi:protein-disulfide isomerase
MRAHALLAGLAAVVALALPVADAAAQRRAARAAPARPAAARDWTRVAVRTPEGVRIGNPAAAVRLVEYGSITCPHCAAFANQGGNAGLYGHVRSGRVSWEYRPYMIFPTDPGLFAALNCLPPGAFFPTVEQLYATQRTWVGRVQAYLEANQAQVVSMSIPARAAAMFRASQVEGLFRARGMTAAQINACITNPANLQRIASNTQRASARLNIPGTPTFFVNGVQAGAIEFFSELEPVLIRAGARGQ